MWANRRRRRPSGEGGENRVPATQAELNIHRYTAEQIRKRLVTVTSRQIGDKQWKLSKGP